MLDRAPLDLRSALAATFAVLGLLVGGYGLATRNNAALYLPSGQVNINLRWGGVMLGFAVIVRLLAMVADRRALRDAKPGGASDATTGVAARPGDP
ncbi:MAG: hypothetical protein ABI910_22355 [Gemmatimonadota bacterium]